MEVIEIIDRAWYGGSVTGLDEFRVAANFSGGSMRVDIG